MALHTIVEHDSTHIKPYIDAVKTALTGEVVDSEPYVLRQGLGNLADMSLVGGSIAWNQLCNGSSVTVPNGHKYYMRKSGTTSIGASTGSAITGLTSGTDNVIDLTQLFGTTTIADYIYALEQATAGAGVAWFRKYFSNLYYGYQSGKIESVNVASRKVTGKNLNGTIYKSGTDNGVQFTVNQDGTVSIQRVSTGSGDAYVQYTIFVAPFTGQVKLTGGVSSVAYAYGFDNNLGSRPYTDSTMSAIQTPSEGNVNADNESSFFMIKGNTYNVVLRVTAAFTGAGVFKPMIRLATVEDATYEPYTEYAFPFDPSIQLRGIPKLVDNKLSYDGDIYTADGTVTRKYGIVDLGTLDYAYISANGYMASQNALSNAKAQGKAIVSDKFVYSNDISSATIPSFTIYAGKFYCALSGYTDPAQFKTAMSGVYLVYELATPTTESANAYQNPQRAFTDGTEEFIDAGVTASTRDVSIPVGNNTTYQLNETLPPTEDYVDGALKFKAAISALGTDESGRTTASRAYTTGEFFYKDGKMYKVLTSIAQGATFTVGTNCQQTTLFAELKALAQ